MRKVLLALIPLVTILVVAFAGGNDPPPAPPPVTVTVHVDGVDADTARDDTIVLTEPAQDYLEDELDVDRGDLADPKLDAGAFPNPPTALNGDPLPLAGQAFPGCRTAFVRNMSSRGGVRPQVIVWHITAGPDRPGWGDNDALTAMSNNPANGVSWTFSIGSTDGNCAYNVPLSMKAWTQAGANPFSVGIEVINAGTEPYFVQGPGREKLMDVTRRVGKRLGIPMQPAIVRNCVLIRPGITEHRLLDEPGNTCAGGHNDAANSRPAAEAQIKQMIAELGEPVAPVFTDRDRRSCRRIHAYRGRDASRRTAGAERRQEHRLKFVVGHGLKCVTGKPQPKEK